MWRYRPLNSDGINRMAELLRPYADEENSALVFFSKINGDELAEFLSILTGQSPGWVRLHFSLAAAIQMIAEFLRDDSFEDEVLNWRFAGEFVGLKVN